MEAGTVTIVFGAGGAMVATIALVVTITWQGELALKCDYCYYYSARNKHNVAVCTCSIRL